MKTNAHGETTVMTKAAALKKAEHNARYRHGTWFVWMHKSGEWYCGKQTHADTLEDAALNVKEGSKVYYTPAAAPGSPVTFSIVGAGIIQMWANNAKAGVL